MKIFEQNQTREEYFNTQINRSRAKFSYCKVSAHDVAKYRSIIHRDTRQRKLNTQDLGPILCLGTRNGREVDLFRLNFFGQSWQAYLIQKLEKTKPSFLSRWPFLESFSRSQTKNLNSKSTIGVEINPEAARKDIWIGSFDQMPTEWAKRFAIVFSNSFDQAQDPHKTAHEWRRVLRPGGYLIFCFAPQTVPTLSDPIGQLELTDVLDIFGGELVFYQRYGSKNGYSEVIIKLDK